MIPPAMKAHGDCRSVPATRDEFSEKRALGRFLIEVKRLRIELTRKCFYLARIDDIRSACEALAHNQIVEIELLSEVCMSVWANRNPTHRPPRALVSNDLPLISPPASRPT